MVDLHQISRLTQLRCRQIILFAGGDDFNKLKSDFMEASKALLGKVSET